MVNEQDTFWSSDFGTEYSIRNDLDTNYEKRIYEFNKYISKIEFIDSVLEVGANIGINLKVLQDFYPNSEQFAVEINQEAVASLQNIIPKENIYNKSIIDIELDKKFDLVLSRGVLIHIHPENLPITYQKIYQYSEISMYFLEY